MSSFLTMVRSILNEETVIPELPNSKLITFPAEGERLERRVSHTELLKIARLQTLIRLEQEQGSLPDHAEMTNLANGSSAPYGVVLANSLGVQEDTTFRVMMLERLILEIVREAIPEECDRFEMLYICDCRRFNFS